MLSSCGEKIDTNAKLDTKIDSLSYSLGVSVAGSLQQSYLEEVNYNAFFKGLKDKFDDSDIEISIEDGHKLIQAYISALRIERISSNLREGKSFLIENQKKEGVITAQGGLQYEIINEGMGKSPDSSADTVIVQYTGTLIDGTVFDSSVEKPEPFKTALNRVIPGWKVGLKLMKEGAKYKFYIPSELGYGANVRPGGIIEPNMALIFEIELLQVIEGPDQSLPLGVSEF